MDTSKIEILERALKREKAARKAAEKILEDKSRELYTISQELKGLLDEKSSTLEGVFKNINDAYLVIDLSANVIEMNDAAKELFGYSIDDDDFNISNLIYKEDAEYAVSAFVQLQEKGFFNNYTTRIFTKNKEIKWVQVNGSLVYDINKNPIAAQGIVRDITAQKAKDEKLVKSENRLSSLITNLDSGILLEDANRKIVLTNPNFCKFFKIPVSPKLLIGQDSTNAAEESKHLFKDPTSFVNRINEILKNKQQVLGDELTLIDGTILERDFIPILENGRYTGHLWSYKNVTLRRQYRRSLENQKQKYSNIIANMNLGLMEVDTNDKILMINQSFSEMSGYKAEELLGKIGSEVFLFKNDEEIIKDENTKRLKGSSNSYEIKVKNKQGKIREWLVSGAPNYDLKGAIIGSIGIHLDITEFKKLQLQKESILKELEKRNKELHEYAHIVSHDLKSPLRSIDALVNWIKLDNEGKFDDITLQNFDLLNSTLETMEKLISDVLEYSSAGTTNKEDEDVDLNKTVNDLKSFLFIPENIAVNVLQELPIVRGDKTKFQQLFQNFISNAIKFCDKEIGLVEIDFEDKNTFYQFSIKDNGIGIEKKYHDKIFKVFHSLNKREDSTGIGLSIVKKIIDLHEGNIWLESELGEGTTFYFTIKKH
ncbi:PAS domain-containing sensor histidine kinase [uncultured Polaribacter sp.]|uniref:PAS domain-containing sensor histidine kinase n=1 Tax=uncultured Polaribacter sp. TaxID=174711 RepID=UPI002638F5B2|nr:PAS domain-containing sensor histidine kinase [uncultured Polaribacter sp.]